jgi:hypothetical protein
MPPVVVGTAVVVAIVVVVLDVVALFALRVKITPNGMQMAAINRTLMTIPTIIQNSVLLFLLFTVGASSHADPCIVSVSFLFDFFNH